MQVKDMNRRFSDRISIEEPRGKSVHKSMLGEHIPVNICMQNENIIVNT